MDLYLENALKCSKETTQKYSTSFSLGVRLLHSDIRDAIYAIYGFVRFADEIVDTFYGFDQKTLLNDFKLETYNAIQTGLSTNPIIHSFQWAVNRYGIDLQLIDSFLYSMEMDLSKKEYSEQEYKKYIYGSAEVVGLMCLQVFCHENPTQYFSLLKPARKLGEAFQKVNFLRDIDADFVMRGRTYFPKVDFSKFDYSQKKEIEIEIERDFKEALQGIAKLPQNARFGVYLAYNYYWGLLKRIQKSTPERLISQRVRINTTRKLLILLKTFLLLKLRGGSIRVSIPKEQNVELFANGTRIFA